MTESDLPQKEGIGVAVAPASGVDWETVGVLSNCIATGVYSIGASTATSASSVGKCSSNSANSGAMVAVISGVDASGDMVSDKVVVCTMQAPVSSAIARQRQIMNNRCR